MSEPRTVALAEAATETLVRRRQIEAVGTAFLRVRPLVIAPTAALMLAALWRAEVPRTQLVTLAIIKGALLSFFVWEAWRYRRREVGSRALFASLLVALLGITAGCAASGGLHSPLVPLLFAPSILGFAAFGAERAGRIMLVLLLLAMAGLYALPALPSFPLLPAAVQRLGILLTTASAAVLLAVGLGGLIRAYERTGYALGQSRAEGATVAEARSRELASLGARLAHEVRNPLAAVKGLLQLEARHASGPRSQERFAVMEGEVARLENILTEYLTFSRAPAEPRPEWVSGPALVRDVLAVFEAKAETRRVRLVADGEGAELRVDPALLRQALFNLVANALEASPPGATITARVRRVAEGARIDVVDQGRGMDAQILARVGTPYFTTRSDGTGLGVVIARRVARQHGGELTFVSQPGAGTTASLLLPPPAAPEGTGP